MDYDEKSKRIYGLGDDVDFDYGWDRDADGFVDWSSDTPFT